MNRPFRALALSLFVRHRLAMVMPTERGSDIERIAELIGAGQMIPEHRPEPTRWTRNTGPCAGSRPADVRGKIVIRVGDESTSGGRS